MRHAALALLALSAASCADFEPRHLGPLEDAVLAIDDRLALARVVRIDAAGADIVDVPLAEGTAVLYERPGAPGEALVLTQGVLGDADEEPVPSEVAAIDRSGLLERWTLSGQYASAVISRDGRYLAALTPRGRLVVENRVEVVDLDAPPGDANPLALSLRSLGGEAPSAAAFSAPLPLGDGELRFAALFAAGQLSLFDLDAPDAPPITVPTTADGASVGPSPVEGVFVGAELIVRADTGRQLLVVTIGEGTGPQRFDVSVRTLAVSGTVRTLVVDERSPSPRVLALGDAALHVFDLETGIETAVEVPGGYRHVLPFDGPAPGDATHRPRLALYGDAPSITFVELGEDAAEVRGAATLALAFRPSSVVADAEAGRLVVFESVVQGGSALDVARSYGRRPAAIVDLFDRSALALVAAPEVGYAAVAASLRQMWVASGEGYASGFDVETQEQRELWLDGRVEALLPLAGSSGRVLAFHSLVRGSFSVLEPDGDAAPLRVNDAF